MLELSPRMRQLLAKASVVADGPTQRMDPNKVGHAKPGGMAPRGFGDDLTAEMLSVWSRANSPGEAVRAEEECARRLSGWCRAPAPPVELVERELMAGTVHFKRMIANSDEHVDELVRKHHVSRKSVYKYRKQYREEAA